MSRLMLKLPRRTKAVGAAAFLARFFFGNQFGRACLNFLAPRGSQLPNDVIDVCWHGRRSGDDKGHFALLFACWLDLDFNVLSESGKKIEQAAYGKVSGPVAQQS